MNKLSGNFKLPNNGVPVDSTVVFLHGLGADGNDLISLADFLMGQFPNTAFYSPDAPTPYTLGGLGFQWFDINDLNSGEITEIKEAENLINQYIDQLLLFHGLRSDRCVVIGFSQGSMMAMHLGPRRKEQLGGIVCISGALITGDTLATEMESFPPSVLIHGANDLVVDCSNSKQAAAFLQEVGIKSEVHILPDLGHSIDLRGVSLITDFLHSVFDS